MRAGHFTRRAPAVGVPEMVVCPPGRFTRVEQPPIPPAFAQVGYCSDHRGADGGGAARRSLMDEREEIQLEVEELEERIAPSQPPGLLGYEGQPGNQGGPQHHP